MPSLATEKRDKVSASSASKPAFPKKRLFEDESDASDSDGGAAVEPKLKINEEFAKRFEHNKKREELHRLEEKFKHEKSRGQDDESDDDESSSEDETEDEEGFLATDALDMQISATLQAIKSKDPRVYDKTVSFYDGENASTSTKTAKEKPVFLQDYHRDRIMKGEAGGSDDDDDDADENPPMTYVQEQAALKKSILSEINAATAATAGDSEEGVDDGDEVDGLKRRKTTPATDKATKKNAQKAPAKAITDADIENADRDPESFLSNFMAAKAWVPADGSNWKAFESDDNDSDLERADEIEHAYNMRFEDPEKSNEVLKSYARDFAAEKSVRRQELTGRKLQRQQEKERKEEEKKERKEERARLKRLKLEQTQEKLRKIKETAGMRGQSLTDDDLLNILEDVWDDEKWEETMRKKFGEEYYAEDDIELDDDAEEDAEDGGKKKKVKKPKWDDDIDITDVVPDYEDDAAHPTITLSDLESEGEAEDDEDNEEDDEDEPRKKKRKTTKDHKKERIAAKRRNKEETSKLEALIDTHMELDDPTKLALSSSSKKHKQPSLFRWRETSPSSFGMTPRDILLAPSDTALNQFAGIKKYASWRDPEQKSHDKRRLGKKARLRKWRREIFGREFEKTGPTYGLDKLASALEADPALETEPVVSAKEGGAAAESEKKKKKRKRSKGKKVAEED